MITKDFKSISVTPESKNKVKVINPTSYPLIGHGGQGAVFKLSSERCVKIYASEKYLRREIRSYQAAQNSPIFPRMYEAGANYIIMEYIKGIPLDVYLRVKGIIPESITDQIVFMIKEMKRLKFTRLDIALRHIFITEQNKIKIIDHVNSLKIKEHRPLSLFSGLKGLGMLNAFLKQVRKIDEAIYLEWKESMGE